MGLIESFVNLIAPLHCFYCDAEGSIACESCLGAELITMPSCCFYCARITKDFATCSSCLRHSSLKAVWSVSDYNNFAKSVVTFYKYDSTREVGKTIINEMLKVLPSADFLITNIPTDSNRVRRRGFDHCALIAKAIAYKRELLYKPLLYRTKSIHQVGAKKSERIKQTNELFQLKPNSSVKDKSILLIDDVATTGATMQSAAKVLKNAGAKEIYGLVFARNI